MISPPSILCKFGVQLQICINSTVGIWEFVREMGCFSERKVNYLMFRSGKRVVFRTELIDWGGMRFGEARISIQIISRHRNIDTARK